MQELSSKYNPSEIEDKWFHFWARTDLFHSEVDPKKKPFTIVIPPPNVTGILHMGHALNNTIQDVLIRSKRMQGFEVLWMPGTDHAGIATQNVVERKLAKDGLTRQDVGREEFLKKVWEWKKDYGSTIIHQLKRMGASCDWSRERFTMDERYSEAVIDVFVSLYKNDLIYRGNYIINWCPRCQTALSDEEAPHHELDGRLYYIKYPISPDEKRDGCDEGLVVATTRPETMLGDTAVAVNPKDKRYKHLIGKTLILPLVERRIRVIADEMVDKQFGTGAVKVTPAHDPNDYQMGKKHSLEFINIMHPNAVLNVNAGDFAGMDRFEAREAIVEELKERKLLVKTELHKHAVGHCYRCHTIIEPYLSKQWFVRMKPLSLPAIRAVKKGEIKFHPDRWTKVYLNWMENIRDWCISRQIWWGHRIPVYYCKDCVESTDSGKKSKNKGIHEKGVIVSKVRPVSCPDCGGSQIEQDPDVLDTWFSSWLWPFATFGWPFLGDQTAKEKTDLKYFYPTNTLVTAPEIIFFWVARMIMAGCQFIGKIPFKDVYIHGTVRDQEGRKMSKSLGNSIDPLEIIKEYGADALRFSLLVTAASGSDIYLSKERFEQGRNFCNKIWNASRFILMTSATSSDERNIVREELKAEDLWILTTYNEAVKKTSSALDAYRFNEAINTVYDFFWHKFCDWYLEMAKFRGDDPVCRNVLFYVLKNILKLLHPFMPFITDEIYSKITQDHKETLSVDSWPQSQTAFNDKESVDSIELACRCVFTLRNLRAELNLSAQSQLNIVISSVKKKVKILHNVTTHIKNLAGVGDLKLSEDKSVPKNCLSAVVDKNINIYVLLEGLTDVEKEKEKIDEQIKNYSDQLSKKETMLKNKDFVKKAPSQVVEKERKKLDEFRDAIQRLKEIRNAFK